MGDPVLHIELRNWADVMVVAPLSAHTLAKFAHGMCDDTLSSVARAWWSANASSASSLGSTSISTNNPMVVAPAMNTGMWQHPVTEQQLQTLTSFAPHPSLVTIVQPQVKTLACGETGDGALAPVQDIVEAVAKVKRELLDREYQLTT
jgi:phosphopantothenoylcysteine decarboxylase